MSNMNPCFYVLPILSLIVFTVYGRDLQRNLEICQTLEPNINHQDKIVNLGLGKTVIIQSDCVRYFQLNLNDPSFLGKFINVEVNFLNFTQDPRFSPIFMKKAGQRPRLYFTDESYSNVNDDCDAYDDNAYINQKKYHQIVLSPEDIKSGGMSYFAMYKAYFKKENYLDITVEYEIKISLSKDFPCPQKCSENGNCNTIEKKCYCDEGFFDLDCSIEPNLLNLEKSEIQIIKPETWEYFFLPLASDSEDIRLDIGKVSGTVFYSLLFNDAITFTLPNFLITHKKYLLSEAYSSLNLEIERRLLNRYAGGALLIGAYNYEQNPVAIQLQVGYFDSEDSSRTTVLYIIMGISFFLVAFGVVLAIIKCATHRRNYEIPENRPQSQELVEDLLNKDEIEKYFPKKVCSHLRSSFPQTVCSICLEDFQKDSFCRQLYCEHIFHDKCIEEWLLKQDNCPNCKKMMTRKAIEDFVKSQKKEKKALKIEQAKYCVDNKEGGHKPEVSVHLAEIELIDHKPEYQEERTLNSKEGQTENRNDIKNYENNKTIVKKEDNEGEDQDQNDEEQKRLETASDFDKREIDERIDDFTDLTKTLPIKNYLNNPKVFAVKSQTENQV